MKKTLTTVLPCLAAGAFCAYAFAACPWGDFCYDVACQDGCGVSAGGVPQIITTCRQDGSNCCECVRYKYFCTVCGHTIQINQMNVKFQEQCSSNQRFCAP